MDKFDKILKENDLNEEKYDKKAVIDIFISHMESAIDKFEDEERYAVDDLMDLGMSKDEAYKITAKLQKQTIDNLSKFKYKL